MKLLKLIPLMLALLTTAAQAGVPKLILHSVFTPPSATSTEGYPNSAFFNQVAHERLEHLYHLVSKSDRLRESIRQLKLEHPWQESKKVVQNRNLINRQRLLEDIDREILREYYSILEDGGGFGQYTRSFLRRIQFDVDQINGQLLKEEIEKIERSGGRVIAIEWKGTTLGASPAAKKVLIEVARRTPLTVPGDLPGPGTTYHYPLFDYGYIKHIPLKDLYSPETIVGSAAVDAIEALTQESEAFWKPTFLRSLRTRALNVIRIRSKRNENSKENPERASRKHY